MVNKVVYNKDLYTHAQLKARVSFRITLSDLAKYSAIQSIARSLCNSSLLVVFYLTHQSSVDVTIAVITRRRTRTQRDAAVGRYKSLNAESIELNQRKS